MLRRSSVNSNWPLLCARLSAFSLPLSPEHRSTIPNVGRMPSALVHCTLPQLLCLCARLPALTRPCCCPAARLHSTHARNTVFTLLSILMVSLPLCWSFSPSIRSSEELLQPPVMSFLSPKYLPRYYRMNTTGRLLLYPAPTTCCSHLSHSVVMLSITSTRRLLAFTRKMLQYRVGKTNATFFFYGDPLVTSFKSVYERQKTNSKEEETK